MLAAAYGAPDAEEDIAAGGGGGAVKQASRLSSR
jgi:hypothetical protein